MTENLPKSYFTFEKQRMLLEKPSKMPHPGPYYPCLVRMDDIQGFPFEYALYFSTDHHHRRGGIWLYMCNGIPTEPGNWKSYDAAVKAGDFDYLPCKPKTNPIFVDEIQGKHHTETCHVNVVEKKVFMTYHHSSVLGIQPTLLATSTDGINFSRINGKEDSVILPARLNGRHTGYFRWAPNPFHKVKYKYIGYSLHGGGDNYHSALWGSNDAINWEKIHVFSPIEGYAMADENLIMIWHEINPNAVVRIGDDEYVLLSAGGIRASGGRARIVKMFEIFLAGDGITLTRECRQVLQNGPPGAPDSEEAAEPTMVRIDDTWHLLYIGTTKKGKRNSIMAVKGRFNLNAIPSKKV